MKFTCPKCNKSFEIERPNTTLNDIDLDRGLQGDCSWVLKNGAITCECGTKLLPIVEMKVPDWVKIRDPKTGKMELMPGGEHPAFHQRPIKNHHESEI